MYSEYLNATCEPNNPNMGVSKNRGTPKSSILIRFSTVNHPFWDTPILGNTHILSHSIFYQFFNAFEKKKTHSKWSIGKHRYKRISTKETTNPSDLGHPILCSNKEVMNPNRFMLLVYFCGTTQKKKLPGCCR